MKKLFLFALLLLFVAAKAQYDCPPWQQTPSQLYDGKTVGWFDYMDANTVIKDNSGYVSRWMDKSQGMTLGTELASGNLVVRGVYKITATTTNYFYTGCAVGDYFIATATTALDASNKVQRVNGNHLVQSTASYQPLLSSDGITHDGSNDFMKTAAFTLNQPCTIYAVLKENAFTDGKVLMDGNTVTKGALSQKTSSGTLQLSAGSEITNNQSIPGKMQIVCFVLDGTSSQLWVDNKSIKIGDVSTGNMGGLTIGADGNNANFASCTFKGIIVRSGHDNYQTQEAIKTWLQYKYNVPYGDALKTWWSFTVTDETTTSIKVDKTGSNVLIDWGDGSALEIVSKTSETSHTYASAFTGRITIYTNDNNIPYTFKSTSNKFNFNINSIPSGITSFNCQGSNTLSGNISSFKPGLTYFYCEGSNTITGNISSFQPGLTYFICVGSNTVTGNLSSLPSGLTYFICRGSNTVSGNLSSLPSELTYFSCYGSNIISDYTSGKTWSNSINSIILVPVAGGGLDATEIDNLCIDLNNATWAGSSKTLYLKGTNASPTSASAAARAALVAKGVAVTTN